MKLFAVIALLSLVAAENCAATDGFEETEPGHLAYAFCSEGEWGYKVSYCSNSVNPTWMSMEDICTPKKKLIHPKFGLNYLEYSVKADGLPLEEYSPKVNYFMSVALSRMSSLFVIHPIDVTVIDVSGDNNSTTMLIHHLVDSYNRTDLIKVINDYFNDGSFNALMASLDSDFSYIDFTLVKDTFRWSSFNIFYNPYFDMILGVLIVALIWYGLCKLGRKCGEKKRKEKEAAEKLLP